MIERLFRKFICLMTGHGPEKHPGDIWFSCQFCGTEYNKFIEALKKEGFL